MDASIIFGMFGIALLIVSAFFFGRVSREQEVKDLQYVIKKFQEKGK